MRRIRVAALLPKAADYVRIITQRRLEDMASIKEAAFRDQMSKWVDFMVMNRCMHSILIGKRSF